MGQINVGRLAQRVERARSVLRKGILYGLGCGGYDPRALSPADGSGKSDCSGFALAWCMGISRKPKLTRPWWVATETVYADAMGKQRVFIKLDRPIVGCAMVYPDANGEQGHCAIVTAFTVKPNGSIATITGIDCHGGYSGHHINAIEEHDLTWFLKKNAIFVTLKEDLA